MQCKYIILSGNIFCEICIKCKKTEVEVEDIA